MLSKKDIEELATGAVKRYFNTCNLVSPQIQEKYKYLQLIIPQYFISNKSGIWSLSLIVHSKG
jgi:hypothetical protein